MGDITIERIASNSKYIIGRVYLDNELICNSLEPPLSSVSDPICIPEGIYRLTFTNSPKFSPRLGIWIPTLIDVPNRTRILLHPGNSVKDTEGCILVGKNTIKGGLTDSTNCFYQICFQLLPLWRSGETMSIKICNKF